MAAVADDDDEARGATADTEELSFCLSLTHSLSPFISRFLHQLTVLCAMAA